MELADKETTAPAEDAAAPLEAEAPAAGENDAASNEQDAEGQPEGDDDGELVVSIGEDAPPQPEETRAPAWVRDLRKQNRELTKRLKELEAERQQAQQPATALPPKPTLESCDYDAERFESELLSWTEAKRKADEAEAAAKRQQEEAEQEWSARLQSYSERKRSLRVEDADDAEAAFKDALINEWGHEVGTMRWAILVDGADDPAMLVYALGKYPERAKELAKIKSLAQFTFKAAKIEADLKVTKRKATPAPEKPITGTASVGVGGATDATLKRLRDEADRTGDRTKVVAYLSQLRKQQRG